MENHSMDENVQAVVDCFDEAFFNLNRIRNTRHWNHLIRLKRMMASMRFGGSAARGLPFCTDGYLSIDYASASGKIYKIVEHLDDTAISLQFPEIEFVDVALNESDPVVELKAYKEWPGQGDAMSCFIPLKDVLNGNADRLKGLRKNGWASWMDVTDAMIESCLEWIAEKVVYWLSRNRGRMLYRHAYLLDHDIADKLQAKANAFFADMAENLLNGVMHVQPREWTRNWKKNIKKEERYFENPYIVHLSKGFKMKDRMVWQKGDREDAPVCPLFWTSCPIPCADPQEQKSNSAVVLWFSSPRYGETKKFACVADLLKIEKGQEPNENPFNSMRNEGWGWDCRETLEEWDDAKAASAIIHSLMEWSRPYLDKYIETL